MCFAGDRNQDSLAAAPGAPQEVQESSVPGGFVPIDTLEGAPLYAQPAPGSQLVLQQNGTSAGGQVTTLAQATCNGMVYGVRTVLEPPTS